MNVDAGTDSAHLTTTAARPDLRILNIGLLAILSRAWLTHDRKLASLQVYDIDVGTFEHLDELCFSQQSLR